MGLQAGLGTRNIRGGSRQRGHCEWRGRKVALWASCDAFGACECSKEGWADSLVPFHFVVPNVSSTLCSIPHKCQFNEEKTMLLLPVSGCYWSVSLPDHTKGSQSLI